MASEERKSAAIPYLWDAVGTVLRGGLVPPAGLEPATRCLEGSGLLSKPGRPHPYSLAPPSRHQAYAHLFGAPEHLPFDTARSSGPSLPARSPGV